MGSLPLLALQARGAFLPGGRGSRMEKHCRYFASPLTALSDLRMTAVPLLHTSPGVRMAIITQSNRLSPLSLPTAGGTCILA